MEYVKRLDFLTFLSEAEVLIGNIWYNPMSQYQDTSMPASLLSLTFFFLFVDRPTKLRKSHERGSPKDEGETNLVQKTKLEWNFQIIILKLLLKEINPISRTIDSKLGSTIKK